VDGCEILHQLKTVVYPIIYRVSTILLVVQDFAPIHSLKKTLHDHVPVIRIIIESTIQKL
jgi:hypothetical protein